MQRISVLLALGLVLMLTGSLMVGAATTSTIDVSPANNITNTGDGSGNGYYEREADLLKASNGTWYLIYAKSQTEFTAGTNKNDLKNDAYVRTSTDDGATWSAETKVLDAASIGTSSNFRGPKICEADGKIWALGVDLATKHIYASTNSGSGWSGQSIVFTSGGSHASFYHIDPVVEGDNIRLFGGITAESDGVGFIMYDGSTDTWDASITSTGVLAQVPDVIKVGSTYYMVGPESSPTSWDYVLFAYTTNPSGSWTTARIATAPCTGGCWSAADPSILKYGDSDGTDDLVVVWAPDKAAWAGGDDSQYLEYLYSTDAGATWSSSLAFTDAYHGSDPSQDFMPSVHMLDANTLQVIFNMGERGVSLGQGDIVSVDWDLTATLGNAHYTTIQDGIDNASDGDTINVAAGTYTENVVLPTGSDLTLLGAEANVDPRGGRAGPESVLDGFTGAVHDTGNGITLPAVPGTVVINGFTITGYAYGIKGADTGGDNVDGATFSYNILDDNGNDGTADDYYDSANNVGGGIRVYNMDASTVSYNVVKNGERGIRLDDASGDGSDGNTVSHNLIHDNEQYGIAVYTGGNNNTIEYNTIYNCADRGIQLGWGAAQSGNVIQYNEIYDVNNDGILITNATNYTITGNTIYNVAFTNQTLGRPTGGDPDPDFSTQAVHGGIALIGTNSSVTITGNVLHDNGEMGVGNPWGSISGAITTTATSDGIWIDSSSDATVHENSIYDNNEFGLENTNTGVTTNAEDNWWGAASGPGPVGPGSGDAVSTNVDYSPWLGATPGTSPMTWGVDSTSSTAEIQAVIDDASSGDTIVLAAGTYTPSGGFTINTAGITIMLEDGTIIQASSPCFIVTADNITITSDFLGGKCIPTSGDHGIVVSSTVTNTVINNLVIRGIEIDGSTTSTGDGIHITSTTTISNLQIFDNYIHGLDFDGIKYDSGVTIAGVHEVQGNLFQDNDGAGINNATGITFTVEYNSWGDIAGPTGTNGDGVSSHLDYTPWTHVAISSTNSSGSPVANKVGEGYQITYTIKMDAKEVYGADFDLEFDNTKLEVKDIVTNTNFTQVYTCTVSTVSEANNSGEISFCGYSTTAVNGSARDVFTVTFEGLDTGTVPLNLDETDDVFSMAPPGGSSTNIYASALTDGSVTVYDATTVTGRVDLQGRPDDTGAVMTFAQGSGTGGPHYGPFTFTTSGYWGSISASNVVYTDTYDITVSMDRYLDVTATVTSTKSVTITTDNQVLTTLVLIGGDANDNDEIDISDIAIIGGQYGNSGGGITDSRADINADDVIDISDLVLPAGNYGKESETAYDSWTP